MTLCSMAQAYLPYPTTKSIFIGYIYSEKGSGSALKTPPDTPKNP